MLTHNVDCTHARQVTELPPAVYPWLKAFDGDDVSAFEACASVLLSW